MKIRSLNLPDPQGLVQACSGAALYFFEKLTIDLHALILLSQWLYITSSLRFVENFVITDVKTIFVTQFIYRYTHNVCVSNAIFLHAVIEY
jgi:hypothetical protein